MSDARRWMIKLGAGWLMGLTVVIPGVSAGTVALILGVYPEWLRRVSTLQLVPLAPLIMGLAAGVLSGVHLVRWGTSVTPDATAAFFLGMMIVAVVGFVLDNPPRGIRLVPAVTAFAAAWWLTLVAQPQPMEAAATPSGLSMVLAGAAGAAAMTLPGISGGTVLILMGLYYPTIEAVVGWKWSALACFAVGVLAGIVLIARVMRAVLQRWEASTMAVLAGLMLGSIRALIPGGWGPGSASAMLAGAILAYLLLQRRKAFRTD